MNFLKIFYRHQNEHILIPFYILRQLHMLNNAAVGIWEVNQLMEAPCLSLFQIDNNKLYLFMVYNMFA